MDFVWKKYKSGTDIRGVASEGVEGEEINLTDDAISRMAAGFAVWLSEKCQKPAKDLQISVGHDSRISAARIKSAVISAFEKAGISVFDCGLSSTPAMFMTTLNIPVDGAVQITASHHPFNRNGLKFFTKDGGLEGADIEQILENAYLKKAPENAAGKTTTVDFMTEYSAILKKLIIDGVGGDKPLCGFKIVVDAGNGAGGFYAKKVLKPLGADISGSQFLEPDGMFPNHIPNPENKEAMESVSRATTENGADLGVIFDTDVDRAGCVDPTGKEISRNRLVALASYIALENAPGGTIVTDSITSSGLKTFIETELGGKHHRFRRGYKNVIDEAVRLNSEGVLSPLAIETSGHAAFLDNYFLDDGAYLITRIIILTANLRKQGKSLESLIERLGEPVEEKEMRFKILCDDFRPIGEKVISGLFDYSKKMGWDIAPDNHEGLRVSFPAGEGGGWFLLRLSVHDPIMPLNIESDEAGGVLVIAEKLYTYLKTCDSIDLSSIEDFVK